jgi:hypothetical protein
MRRYASEDAGDLIWKLRRPSPLRDPEAGFCIRRIFAGGLGRLFDIRRCSVDVARGLVLLFGIGTKALAPWDSRTRRNNLFRGLVVRPTFSAALSSDRRQVQADRRRKMSDLANVRHIQGGIDAWNDVPRGTMDEVSSHVRLDLPSL